MVIKVRIVVIWRRFQLERDMRDPFWVLGIFCILVWVVDTWVYMQAHIC